MLRSNVTRLLASAPLVALVAIAASAPHSVHAQVTTGTVRGVVKDPGGKAFKGANITLTSSGGDKLKTTSNSSGEYTFIGVLPGTYTLHVDVQSYSAPDQTVTVVQDIQTSADFGLTVSTVNTGTTKVTVSSGASQTRQGQSNTQYNVSARTEQLTKSQPNNLYQFPGLVFGQPGITPDPSGYTHIRGSDQNQVGFSIDGIDVTEPITNQFATNIVTVGLKSANLLTGGADASYGGKTGGFINEATMNGRDIKGGVLEYTDGPDWDYQGTNLQYGNVTGNGKFDYYFATVLFQNAFPGNTNVTRVDPSNDELVKLNYYLDSKNTITAYANNGREKYNYFQLQNAAGVPYSSFNHVSGLLAQTNNFQQDGEDQGYEFEYLTLKHQFSDTSFATIQQYKIFSRVQFNLANVSEIYEEHQATKSGTKIDYTNQVSVFDKIQAGFAYTPEQVHFREVASLVSPLSAPDAGAAPAVGQQYYNDFTNAVHPTETDFYVSNQARLLQNKATLDLGLRYSQQMLGLTVPNYSAFGFTVPPADDGILNHYDFNNKFAPHYVDPRVGISYTPKGGSNGITFRTSYAVNSQFADTQLVNRVPTITTPNGPFNTFYSDSETSYANNEAAYVLKRYAPFNALGPAHSNDFDLGVDKSFMVSNGFVNGSYNATLTGYRRVQYDLIQYDRLSLEGNLSGPRFYNNDGKGHSSGIEFELTKRLVNKTDWNGFLSYTNATTRASNSNFDTGYLPYFLNSDIGDPNLTDAQYRQLDKNEYATSYDQKHTVAVVANKRFWKYLSSTVVLDAGSGFPFAGGSAADGNVLGADSQHSDKLFGGAEFTEVPTVLLDGRTLQPINPVVGRTGWHYKFSLNTDIIIKEGTTAFVNIDNLFTRNTPLTYATSTQAGQIYYHAPSAAYPQGQVYYGASTIITPRFISFGIRTKF